MVGFAAQSQAIRELHRMSGHLWSHLVFSQLLLAFGYAALLLLALQVQLEGTDLGFMQPGLPEDAQQELHWCVALQHTTEGHSANLSMQRNIPWCRDVAIGSITSHLQVFIACCAHSSVQSCIFCAA